MNPEVNPFTPVGKDYNNAIKKYPCIVKPIDRANEEIKLLKAELIDIRNKIEPLIEEYNKKLKEEEREEPVMVEKSWWFG